MLLRHQLSVLSFLAAMSLANFTTPLNALVDALYEVSTPGHPNWLTVTGVPVSRANEMLDASYQLFKPSGTNNTTILRTVGYALPAVLHKHVRTVVPTTCFVSTLPLRQTSRSRTVGVTADSMGSRSPGRCCHVAMTKMNLKSTRRTPMYQPQRTRMQLGRRNQNIQYTESLTYPTPHTFYSIGGEMAPDDVFLTWLKYLIDLETIPQTISASYGKYENIFPVEYTTAVCELFAQLGARGVSVLFPSGNEGVGENCEAKDGSGRVQFVPEFPSSCPWVTSVGGTMRQHPEVAAITSGAASRTISPPIYQDPAVPAFCGNSATSIMANSDGRGIPDVAAQAVNYFYVIRNEGFQADGTSFATPTVAAIFSLLNDYLLSIGKKPLGFLNPWLYGLGVVGMNDIKSGSNPGCGTEGFSAVAGWDPVTGLGTPDFLNLQAIIDYMNQFSPQGDQRRAIYQYPRILQTPHEPIRDARNRKRRMQGQATVELQTDDAV
ncbi:peptidase S8/S53 domain-containing protein [Lactarius quietus]|nr:peptidase S8/S53 domain-containing protein [Lactarius quietus]KAF8259493.1 peptidase S8/S53 domain-containing protein [Lactarius quietus]